MSMNDLWKERGRRQRGIKRGRGLKKSTQFPSPFPPLYLPLLSTDIRHRRPTSAMAASPKGGGFIARVGLEVHARIAAKRKIFSPALSTASAAPNSAVSFIHNTYINIAQSITLLRNQEHCVICCFFFFCHRLRPLMLHCLELCR